MRPSLLSEFWLFLKENKKWWLLPILLVVLLLGALVFLSGTPAEVVAEAQACLKAWGDKKGYVLTTGCDFTKDVPLKNIMALMSLKNTAPS